VGNTRLDEVESQYPKSLPCEDRGVTEAFWSTELMLFRDGTDKEVDYNA
jgi:hypothetical protein